MPYLIGIDEAGYGPNLGPLVIAASVWHVEGELDDCDLYKLLRGCVSKSAPANNGRARLAIADSKALYKPPQGVELLERGVLTALALTDVRCTGWNEIWPALDLDHQHHLHELPWHLCYELGLPLECNADEVLALATQLRGKFAKAGVRLVALRGRTIFPQRFNEAVDRCGTKGEALSQFTLELAAAALSLCGDEHVLVVCDKHGGRNRYGRLLQMQFPDPLIEIHGEELAESIYRWGPAERRVEVRFRAGGESFLPAALASMTAKYLRELAMRAFNDFWCSRVADLSPTAGYPLDARRFKAAIEDTQVALGIEDRILWRSR